MTVELEVFFMCGWLSATSLVEDTEFDSYPYGIPLVLSSAVPLSTTPAGIGGTMTIGKVRGVGASVTCTPSSLSTLGYPIRKIFTLKVHKGGYLEILIRAY